MRTEIAQRTSGNITIGICGGCRILLHCLLQIIIVVKYVMVNALQLYTQRCSRVDCDLIFNWSINRLPVRELIVCNNYLM